jgi:predicted RNA-binding protein YlqC (UPF0109 family)
MPSTIDLQFIEFIVKSLVSKPEAVVVNRRIDEKGVLLELTVDPSDLGRIIGKRGATAQSLRVLLRALGTKNDARYNLKIVDNDRAGGEHAEAGNEAAEESYAGYTEQPVDNSTEQPVEDQQQMQQSTQNGLDEYDDINV